MNNFDKLFLTTVSLLIVATVLISANRFLIREDYDYFVEAPCDQRQTTCFIRDCSGEDCPSNGLDQYRIFAVSAVDFRSCTDNSCLPECEGGTIECAEIFCGESAEDECVNPQYTAQ